MSEEVEGPAGGRGKWAKAGVPKRGWVCEGIEDIGEPALTCQMCEARRIRYVHFMAHARYAGVLQCGCVCSGHMEEDYAAARERERAVKGRTRRRSHWPKRAGWHQSGSGNWTIRVDGLQVTVTGNEGAYRVVVSSSARDRPYYGRRDYGDLERAKLASFDAFQWVKEKQAVPR